MSPVMKRLVCTHTMSARIRLPLSSLLSFHRTHVPLDDMDVVCDRYTQLHDMIHDYVHVQHQAWMQTCDKDEGRPLERALLRRADDG